MQIAVISPESADPREVDAMEGMFSEGLGRYHVRKPTWTEAGLEAWLRTLPHAWRPRIVLHRHPGLAQRLLLAGTHAGDAGGDADAPGAGRSCHDLATLRGRIGRYGSLFFGPIFPSLSKPGYGPAPDFPWGELSAALKGDRGAAGTRVLAIGGITAGGLARCRELGFDGAAAMGAVWGEADPVRAFAALRDAARKLEEARDAA